MDTLRAPAPGTPNGDDDELERRFRRLSADFGAAGQLLAFMVPIAVRHHDLWDEFRSVSPTLPTIKAEAACLVRLLDRAGLLCEVRQLIDDVHGEAARIAAQQP